MAERGGDALAPLSEVFERPSLEPAAAREQSEQHARQPAPAFEHVAPRFESARSDLFEIVRARGEALVAPTGLEFDKHLARRSLARRQLRDATHGAAELPFLQRLFDRALDARRN